MLTYLGFAGHNIHHQHTLLTVWLTRQARASGIYLSANNICVLAQNMHATFPGGAQDPSVNNMDLYTYHSYNTVRLYLLPDIECFHAGMFPCQMCKECHSDIDAESVQAHS